MPNCAMTLLVSEQPMPSLLAACDKRLEVDEVLLLYTPQMDDAQRRLAQVLSRRGIAVRSESISDSVDPRATAEVVRRIVAAEPSRWIVNVTGGTKPMSIGAALAARETGVHGILYLDHATGMGHWLFTDRETSPIDARLGLSDVLEAHGWSLTRFPAPSSQEIDLAWKIFHCMDRHARQAWNGWMEAVRTKCEPRRRGGRWRASPVPRPADLLSNLPNADRQRGLIATRRMARAAQEAGFVQLTEEGLRVPDQRTHRFLAGDWLSAVTWSVLKRNQDTLGLSDLAAHAETKSAQGTSAEIDVLALQGRRLLVIEAKTARLSGRGVQEHRPMAVADRLAFLKRMGGLKTSSILVSLEPLDHAQKSGLEAKDTRVIDGVTACGFESRLLEALR